MIYAVRHRTTYTYESEVTFARCVLRLTPQASATQSVLESTTRVTPDPSRITDRIGAFDEATRTVVIETPHISLVIYARSRIDVHTGPGRLDFAPAWEDVRSQSLETADLGPEGPASFIYPSVRAPLTPPITEYARA